MKARLAGGAALLLAAWITLMALTHPYGTRFAIGIWPVPPGTPWSYQLESGFVPALTVLTLLGAVAGAWHHVNCHKDGCWRTGKHKVDGTPWCSRHQHEARSRRTDSDRLDEIIALLKARQAG